jgi:hypothetical protein
MWTADGSGEGSDDEFYRRTSPPDNEIPVAVPLNRMLARTENAAVALTGAQVYTTGLTFTLVARVRRGTLPMDHLHQLMWVPASVPPTLLVGLELADGRRLDNIPDHDSPDDLVFSDIGGSGSELSIDQEWWLHPIPPEGPLRFVLRCVPLGIEDTVTELDTSPFRSAAQRVEVLWPWTPPEQRERPPPPPPEVPSDSWFSSA